MAARAIWKGVIQFGKTEVAVKLYSAVQDRSIHFRLLHRSDLQPVRQQLVSAGTQEPVEQKEVRKAFPVTRGRLVVFEDEELETIVPEASRDIEVSRFVDPAQIDHRWYERAYYLGPDTGSSSSYFALAAALARSGKEGVARWVMRKKSYIGALREENGYLMLITLRHAEEVVAADALDAPEGRPLQARELEMAEQLVHTLEEKFDPTQFRDEYRARVMELVEAKSKGHKPKVKLFKPKKTDDTSLADALEASLAGTRRKARG